jgi:hypothetical protein
MTENLFLFTFFNNIFSISSPVVTGTVDFVMIILNLLIDFDISFDTEYIWLRSAPMPFFLVGVPTHIKTISDFFTELSKSVEDYLFYFDLYLHI